MDLERMIETLKSGGASQAEIDQVVESYTQNKYQPQPVSLQPAFYLESDQCVQLGRESHAVRLLNVDDLRRLLPKMVEMIRYLLQEQGSKEKVEEVLDKTSPMHIISLLTQKIVEVNLKGDYPDWFVSLLEEVAHLASNENQKISPQFLISLPPSQFTALIHKIIEVNQHDFLALWANVPPAIRLTLSILASQLTSVWKNLNQNLVQLEVSSGGAVSTGKSSSSNRSAKKPASAKVKSAAVV